MSKSKAMIAGRSIWYVLRTVLILLSVAALCWGVFLTALNMGNLYILATEGMKLRAECVLQDGPKLELTEYFTTRFIENDKLLVKTEFDNYTITDFSYNLAVERLTVLPWSVHASMQAIERVPSISGSINGDFLPKGADPADYPLPEWKSGRYLITFAKVEGRWYISTVTYIEEAPEEKPKNTPDMSLYIPAG
ncbi:MAG: hypothetical protein BWY11_01857 [Firmicutes bacterium ADurb.Bin182]|nr:MAG: hypothetical protein BWY11_01857 [Firmicutes bacterium ADurb.Bin182]